MSAPVPAGSVIVRVTRASDLWAYGACESCFTVLGRLMCGCDAHTQLVCVTVEGATKRGLTPQVNGSPDRTY